MRKGGAVNNDRSLHWCESTTRATAAAHNAHKQRTENRGPTSQNERAPLALCSHGSYLRSNHPRARLKLTQASSLSFFRPLNSEGQSEPRCSRPDSLGKSGWSVVCMCGCCVCMGRDVSQAPSPFGFTQHNTTKSPSFLRAFLHAPAAGSRTPRRWRRRRRARKGRSRRRPPHPRGRLRLFGYFCVWRGWLLDCWRGQVGVFLFFKTDNGRFMGGMGGLMDGSGGLSGCGVVRPIYIRIADTRRTLLEACLHTIPIMLSYAPMIVSFWFSSMPEGPSPASLERPPGRTMV